MNAKQYLAQGHVLYLGPSADSPSFGRVASVLGLRLGHIGSSRDHTLNGEVG